MSTKTTELTTTELQTLLAESQAREAAIAQAEADARRVTELQHYREAATSRAHACRDRRDEAKNRLDQLAAADTIDLNELFTAFLEFKSLDAAAGALETHATRINTIDPLGRNTLGVDRSHVIGCRALYERLTWTDWLNGVVAERTRRARTRHAAELEDEAHTKIRNAGDQARAKAAAADATL